MRHEGCSAMDWNIVERTPLADFFRILHSEGLKVCHTRKRPG